MLDCRGEAVTLARRLALKFQLNDDVREKFRRWRGPLAEWRRGREEMVTEDGVHLDMDLGEDERPTTDPGRIQLARRRFGNHQQVDPTVNLSFHGYKRFGGRRAKHYDRRKMLPLASKSFVLSHGSINPSKGFEKYHYPDISEIVPYIACMFCGEEHQGKSGLDIHKRVCQEVKRLGYTGSVSTDVVTQRVKMPLIKQLKNTYSGHYKRDEVREIKAIVSRSLRVYAEGFIEARDLVSQYKGPEVLATVTEQNAGEIVAAEEHLVQYERYYGTGENFDSRAL